MEIELKTFDIKFKRNLSEYSIDEENVRLNKQETIFKMQSWQYSTYINNSTKPKEISINKSWAKAKETRRWKEIQTNEIRTCQKKNSNPTSLLFKVWCYLQTHHNLTKKVSFGYFSRSVLVSLLISTTLL